MFKFQVGKFQISAQQLSLMRVQVPSFSTLPVVADEIIVLTSYTHLSRLSATHDCFFLCAAVAFLLWVLSNEQGIEHVLVTHLPFIMWLGLWVRFWPEQHPGTHSLSRPENVLSRRPVGASIVFADCVGDSFPRVGGRVFHQILFLLANILMMLVWLKLSVVHLHLSTIKWTKRHCVPD